MSRASVIRSLNLRALILIAAAILLLAYVYPEEPLWSSLLEKRQAGVVSLGVYLAAGLVAANLFALGVFLALLGIRRGSPGPERTRAGLRAKMAGANALAVAWFLTGLVEGAPDVLAAVAGGSSLLFGGLGFALLRKGWKYDSPAAAHVLAEDPRPPVVYIRSFQDDATLLARPWQNWMRFWLPTNFEQDLAGIMNRVGPFVAVGRPGEPLPELGAARFYFGDDEWRPRIAELMDQARLVAIRSGTTANLWWEIDQAVARVPPTRLVLIAHGTGDDHSAFEEKLAERVGWPGSLANVQPPRRSLLVRLAQLGAGDGYFAKLIYFGPDWRPHVEFIGPTLRPEYLLRFHKPLAAPLERAFDKVLQELGVPLWRPGPSRLKAAAIATLIGVFGAHHFYLGNKRRGVYYLAFWWTMVPLFLAWFDAAKLLLMDEARFRQITTQPPPSTAV